MSIPDDLRSFIEILDSYGELLRVEDQVDWKYEIGERSKFAFSTRVHSKALLFENIKDYPGHKLLTNGLISDTKIALALGLKPQLPFAKLSQIFAERTSSPIDPVIKDRGPVADNFLTGGDIDLLRLPAPWWNKQDIGRYIGTWHLNITKDPETEIRNIGIYRMQLLDSMHTAISVSPKAHLKVHLQKAEEEGKPLEMAVVIGVDEPLIMAAASAQPYGVDEFAVAGGLRRKAVELIKCLCIDLEVPANAEIVLEGRILPKKRIKEGPFIDYAGTPQSNPFAYIFEVDALLHRNKPIFRGAAVGLPGAEDHLLCALMAKANKLDFHGSNIRQRVQNFLLKYKLYKSFQFTGRLKRILLN